MSDTRLTRPLSELAALVNDFASRPERWIERVRLRVGERRRPSASTAYSPPLSIMNRYDLADAAGLPTRSDPDIERRGEGRATDHAV